MFDGGGRCGDGGMGAVVASASCCSLAVTTVLVGVAEMAAELDEGFGGGGFPAPFAAGDVEQARRVDDIVADADDGGFTRCVVAGGGETYANVELSEEGLNRSGRVPWGLHAELIGVELILGDFSVVRPKVSEEGEARHVAVSESGIVEVLDVVICDGVENLRAEGFIDFIVRAENGAGNDVETVDFCDLVVGESGGMIDNLGWINWWHERSIGESCVGIGREGERNMTMEPIAAV